MVEQALLVARIAFVVLLYLFIWRIVRLSVRDVRAPQESLILSPEAVRAAGGGALFDDRPPPAETTPTSLLVRGGPVFPAGTRVLLDGELVYGRAADCDVVLAADGTVSGRHARTFHVDGAVHVEDLGSTNGTFVNGARLDGPHRLRPGDVVAIGATELVYGASA